MRNTHVFKVAALKIEWAVLKAILESKKLKYSLCVEHTKGNVNEISRLWAFNRRKGELLIKTDKYFEETLNILSDKLKRADIQVSVTKQIKFAADKLKKSPEFNLTIGVAENQQNPNELADLVKSFLVECADFENAKFLHDSIEIKTQGQISKEEVDQEKSEKSRWIAVKIKSALGMQAIEWLPREDNNGYALKYNVVVSFGLDGSEERQIDFSSMEGKEAIKTLRLMDKNGVIQFLRGLAENVDDWDVNAASGPVGDFLDKSDNPFNTIPRSSRLKYILLLDVVEPPFDLPDGKIVKEKNTVPCTRALGQKPLDRSKKAVCLSIPENIDGYEGVIKKRCARYKN